MKEHTLSPILRDRMIKIPPQSTQRLTYNSIQEVPNEGKAIINMDRNQIPNIRLTRCQNENFRIKTASNTHRGLYHLDFRIYEITYYILAHNSELSK
ncbi:hypothetical protein H5410_061192 [Solanum commersonii]|uniref:Uncharacterized protein n=1 Tax=Solanum commersonii TaxID=4109 RepID=A0A9J5W7B5_SOLCO|nr:hypothetical protein H5410_061192 [Solanum commersonii]